MKNNEMVLQTSDLTAVGINAQLTSNDLVEVVAHDIYEKYMGNLEDMIKRSKGLNAKWKGLFDEEIEGMRQELIKHGVLEEKEEIKKEYGRDKTYWNDGVALKYFLLEEKEKGTKVTSNSWFYNYPTGTKVRVKLQIFVNDYDKDDKVSFGEITGTINIQTTKKFGKVITVPNTRFKKITEETKALSDEVDVVLKTLPTNGLLSIERFTREARVKMNKKIISSQSPEFKEKMTKLFNIKL